MNRPKILIFALISIGAISTIAQVVLMREVAVVFHGNELSLGTTLAGWLFWTGIGSFLSGRIIDRVKNTIPLFATTQILFLLSIYFEILLVRNIRAILGIEHGVLIGYVPMMVCCFFLLLPLCLITGFLFILGCKVYIDSKKEIAPQVGQVYIYDGVGDILGGMLFTYWLVYFLTPFQTITYFFLLNLLVTLLILKKQFILKSINIILLAIIGLSISFHQPDFLQQFSKKLQWRGYNLITSKDSIYGNIAITKEENQYSFYENGLPVFVVPDKISSEQLIHLPMVIHPAPKQILMIGGGLSGGLTEIFKHPVTGVAYVELDPMMIDLAKKYLPEKDLKTLNKCQVHLMDGRLFVKKTLERFDLIMVNLPDPSTAQLNRFYTKEFFEEIKNILKPDGVFSIAVTSNEDYLSQELKNFNGCIYKTLKAVFKEVMIAPGDKLIFFASPEEGVVTCNSQVLSQRFISRKIQTTYVNEYYFPYRLIPDRIDFVKKEIESYKGADNTDFYPICYFYDIVLWSTQFSTSIRLFFNWFAKINLYWVAGLLIILVLVHLLITNKRPRFVRTSIPIAIMTTGYAGITLEIILVFGFQVLYGYVYHRIGIIIASFMVGLVIGTLLINRILTKISDKQGIKILARIEFSIFVYSLLLPLVFILLSNLKTQTGIFIAVELLFPILTIITGIFVGAEFPLANKLYLKNFHLLGKTAGLIYGFDLLGACLGGLLSTILFIPMLGIFQTCIIAGLLNLASFILVVRSIAFSNSRL